MSMEETEIEKLNQWLNLISATFQAQVESAAERLISHFQAQVESAVDSLRPLFKEWDDILEQASKIMGNNGWWIVLDLPIDFYSDLIEIGDKVTREELTNHIVHRANYKRCERLAKIVEAWEIDVFERRREHFAQALWAHIRKKYCVTVPALLVHIEGIIREFENTPGGWRLEGKMKKFETRFPQSESPERGLIALMNFYNIKALKNLYTPHKPEIGTEPIDLNRHAALHGLWLGYSTEVYSTKLFLLLDMLHSMLRNDVSSPGTRS